MSVGKVGGVFCEFNSNLGMAFVIAVSYAMLWYTS